jgi:hypothetical protein
LLKHLVGSRSDLVERSVEVADRHVFQDASTSSCL